MSHIPPFLEQLDLGLDADERGIRRAYARRLKLIDQEADLAGFQQLREAYETALNWARYQAQAQAAAAQSDTNSGAEVAESTGDRLQPHTDSEPEQLASSGEAAMAETMPSPDTLAHAVFEDLLASLQLDSLKEKLRAVQALEQALADLRLVNIDARGYFEWLVARTLAEGWRPGHEVLFVAAAECFDWFNDQHRLVQFGRVGQFINTALNERSTYDRQSGRARDTQRQLILQLRQAEHPGAARVIKNLPHLEQLIRTFPHWLSIITPADNINRWREWDQSIPSWRRRLTYQSPVPSMTPAPKKSVSWNRPWVAFFIFMAIIQLAKLGNQSPSSSSSHSSPSSTSRTFEPSSADWKKPEPLPLDTLNPLAKHQAYPSDNNLYPELQPNHDPKPKQTKPRERPAASLKPVAMTDHAGPRPDVPLDLTRHFREPMLMLMQTPSPRSPPSAPVPLPAPAYRLSGKEPGTPEPIAPAMPPVDYSLKPVP